MENFYFHYLGDLSFVATVYEILLIAEVLET